MTRRDSRPPDLTLTGRVVRMGVAEGAVLASSEAIGFLGGVDGETGIVTEKGHPLQGASVAGRILVFPTGKGSTVGSYVLYQLAANGCAPAAILNARSEPIVAVGAIISDIPMVDLIPVEQLKTRDYVRVTGATVELWSGGAEP